MRRLFIFHQNLNSRVILLLIANINEQKKEMKTRALERMKIDGFKSIKSLDLELDRLNVLIGANGSGKSNFIGIFHFLNQLVSQNLQIYVAQSGGADQILHFGRSETTSLDIELWFRPNGVANGYTCSVIPTADDAFIFSNEAAHFHDRSRYSRPYREYLGEAHRESRLSESTHASNIAKYVLRDMKSWRIYHFHDTSTSAKVKQTGDINDNIYLRQDASNLAAYLYMLQETEKPFYRNIIETVRLVAPFFNDFVLRPSPHQKEKIRLEWQERGSDALFSAHTLSDGTLRFISLATLFLQPPDNLPATILLDEPELGLHPYAITLLAELIRSVSQHTQVIVATQSVTLVNQFDPDDIIVVDREGKESTFRHLPSKEMENWLDEYGLGDLWEKNLLGGRPAQ